MQDSLYPLSSKDVEAIGRSRANRSVPQNMKYCMWASMVACLAGIYCAYTIDKVIGIVIMIVGTAVLFVYSNNIDKKRKAMVRKLKREWREEKGEAIEK